MIRHSAYSAALPLASKLAESEKTINVKTNTVLSELLSTVPSNENLIMADTVDLEAYGTYLTYATDGFISCDDEITASQHSQVLSNIVEELSRVVLAHISFAKNTVTPNVIQFNNNLVEYYNNIKPLDPASLFTIIQLGGRFGIIC